MGTVLLVKPTPLRNELGSYFKQDGLRLMRHSFSLQPFAACFNVNNASRASSLVSNTTKLIGYFLGC